VNEQDDAPTPTTSAAPAPALSRLHDAAPHARVLSNGRYFTVVTGAGTGLSQCEWVAVTRWSGDRAADHDGIFVYLRDLDSGEVWSLGASPLAAAGGSFSARCAPGSVTLGRRHEGIEAACEVCVPAGADAELRRLTLRNRSSAARLLEVTVYAEIVAGHRGGDSGHPAFSKLFVETALDASTGLVSARRRPRSSEEAPRWVAATLTGDGELQVETDRARFLGRGRSVHSPAALAASTPLSGSTGAVLDPVFALRRTVSLEPGAEAGLAFVLAAGTAREDVAAAVAKLAERGATAEGAKELLKEAAASERARRRRFGLSGDEAELAQEVAGAMLYAHPLLAAPASVRETVRASSSPLAALGLRADSLLVVAPLGHGDAGRVTTLAATLAYLRDLGLDAALALLCEQEDCRVADCVHRDAAAAAGAALATAAELGEEAVATLKSEARWLVGASIPNLADADADAGDAPSRAPRQRAPKVDEAPAPLREKLLFDNGYGAFAGDGREYVMRVGPAALAEPGTAAATSVPPMPWSNVIANERFGFLVTETGAACTWAGNSRQNKLTPWSNDPISDPHGEALYLRDHASGRFWSPLPGPAPSGAWSEARHGMGWSRWMQRSEAIEQQVTMFIAGDDPVKITRVRLINRGSRERSLSLYSFARLVLGVQPGDSSRFVVTSAAEDVLLARNPLSEDHGDAVAFAAVLSGADRVSWTTDRVAFLGRGGTMLAPRSVAEGGSLDGSLGGDPCFAFEVPVTLPARGEVEVVFALGQGVDRDAVSALVAKYREAGAADKALEESKASWRELATSVEVATPSRSFDLMMNGWLLYQALGCRIRARSAYYQSGGAFGFRDQLQDSSALVYARPDLSRAQLLLHAAHQFAEGDVLHWWHPPAARGTRTRFSDDLLWLPYLAATYIGTTGDESLLDDKAPFVRARPLAEGEEETYLQPTRAPGEATIYDHCCRAIDRSLATGVHGLPLMGSGDWNDGMNRVGRLGRGESVWMAFFLATILDRFLPLVEKRADWETLRRYRTHREKLAAAIEDSTWDGKWYRRAYYDDGTVLGSADSEECRIDALAQAWSVLSGSASPERAKSAMAAVEEHLVDEKAGIVRLLWPPFDRTDHDPGYIKGYLPGIRENGGQYTHAAMWVIRALAVMGTPAEREKAMRWFEMVSPVVHARSREEADVYKVEPYVVAADIYGAEPHLGRGGWTWYTGSAAWMYRTGLESLLGLTIEEGRLLRIRPCIPDAWPGFRLKYRLPDRRTVYDIEVENPTGRAEKVVAASMGALAVPVDRGGARIVLRRDGKTHKVKVVLG
jgi:cellobiose phosphorylase